MSWRDGSDSAPASRSLRVEICPDRFAARFWQPELGSCFTGRRWQDTMVIFEALRWVRFAHCPRRPALALSLALGASLGCKVVIEHDDTATAARRSDTTVVLPAQLPESSVAVPSPREVVSTGDIADSTPPLTSSDQLAIL